jgi:hypothetical protein
LETEEREDIIIALLRVRNGKNFSEKKLRDFLNEINICSLLENLVINYEKNNFIFGFDL